MINFGMFHVNPQKKVTFAILGYICDMIEEKASSFIVQGHPPLLMLGDTFIALTFSRALLAQFPNHLKRHYAYCFRPESWPCLYQQ